MEELRTCSRCGEARPISEYRANQFGHRVKYCRKCYNKQCAEYNRRNKDKVAARVAKWDREHPGRGNERSRRHKEKNREKVNARRRELHALNPEQRNSVKRVWRDANREEENRKSAESMRAWRAINKDRVRFLNHVHRSRKRSDTLDHHTVADVLDIFKLQKGRCAYCKKDIRVYYEIDHIEPIVRGGHNGRRNIQLTCMRCNRSKKDKDPLVFARLLGRLL
jgi:hypothetical protein